VSLTSLQAHLDHNLAPRIRPWAAGSRRSSDRASDRDPRAAAGVGISGGLGSWIGRGSRGRGAPWLQVLRRALAGVGSGARAGGGQSYFDVVQVKLDVWAWDVATWAHLASAGGPGWKTRAGQSRWRIDWWRVVHRRRVAGFPRAERAVPATDGNSLLMLRWHPPQPSYVRCEGTSPHRTYRCSRRSRRRVRRPCRCGGMVRSDTAPETQHICCDPPCICVRSQYGSQQLCSWGV